MKLHFVIFQYLFFFLLIHLLTSCEKDKTNTGPVITAPILGPITAVTNLTSISASSGGIITSDGGSEVSARGICWNTNPNPTISLTTKSINGSGTGSFVSFMTSLNPATTYYIRAYASNNAGTAYSDQDTFTTRPPENAVFNPNLTYGSVSDYEGNIYKTIVIGTQTWMAENLRTTVYQNGDSIPNGRNNNWNSSTPAYAVFENKEINNTKYGKLYNWFAVTDPRNLCPVGWHVPSETEMITLENFLGGTNVAGGKLKSISSLWKYPNAGATNESGFSGLPGGVKEANGSFREISENGNLWTSTEEQGFGWQARFRYLSYANKNLFKYYYNKNNGYAVRCVKD